MHAMKNRKECLAVCLKGTGVDMDDITMLVELLQVLQQNGEKFTEWVMNAEDAIKVLRKDAELNKMMKRVPQ